MANQEWYIVAINKNNNKIKTSKPVQHLWDGLIKLDQTGIDLFSVIVSGRNPEERQYVRSNCALFNVKMAIDSLGITRVVKQLLHYFSSFISPLLGETVCHSPLAVVPVKHSSHVAATELHWDINPCTSMCPSETPHSGCCQRKGVSLRWAHLLEW